MSLCESVCTHIWEVNDSLGDSAVSFHLMCLRDGTEVIKLDRMCLTGEPSYHLCFDLKFTY